MRARKYSIYIKSLKGVSTRIRFQGQKSTRKGDTEMSIIVAKNQYLIHCTLDKPNDIQSVIDSKQKRQAKRLEEE